MVRGVAFFLLPAFTVAVAAGTAGLRRTPPPPPPPPLSSPVLSFEVSPMDRHPFEFAKLHGAETVRNAVRDAGLAERLVPLTDLHYCPETREVSAGFRVKATAEKVYVAVPCARYDSSVTLLQRVYRRVYDEAVLWGARHPEE